MRQRQAGLVRGRLVEELAALTPTWDPHRPVVSHFGADPEAGQRWLSMVGLNAIPAWCKPFRILSTGMAYRAETARPLSHRPDRLPSRHSDPDST